MKTHVLIILLYFVGANLLGFASMGIDKKKAIRHEWRVSEAMLFLFALIGGSLGSLLGMKTFHHKTKKKRFTILIPFILIVQAALVAAAFSLHYI